MSCSVVGCDRPAKARGWCHLHYRRWREHGDPLTVGSRWKLSLSERFWSKVASIGSDGCWPWIGQLDRNGYGTIRVAGQMRTAPRVAWELATERTIPSGFAVLHRCDNPPCCNPAHLFLGTQADNMADMAAKGRSRRGSRSTAARLSAEDVSTIRRRYANGDVSQDQLAQEFGVSQTNISQIVRGLTWREEVAHA